MRLNLLPFFHIFLNDHVIFAAENLTISEETSPKGAAETATENKADSNTAEILATLMTSLS